MIEILTLLLWPVTLWANAASDTTRARADILEWTAPLEAALSAEVCALIAAPVRQVRVQEGDHVSLGDTLVLLDDTELRLAAARAQLTYQQRQGYLDRAALLHAQGGLSTQELETLRYEVESARLRWDQTLLDLSRTVLLAPLTGQVAQCQAQAGQPVTTGQVLLVLVDPTDLKAELYLPAAQLAQVRLHQIIRAIPVTGPGRPLLGQVTYLSPILDPHSGQGRMRLLFPQAGRFHRPGTLIRVQLGQE